MHTARDIMTRDVFSVFPETDLEELARLFVEKGVSTLPVIDAQGRLSGIISASDLVERDQPCISPRLFPYSTGCSTWKAQKSLRRS